MPNPANPAANHSPTNSNPAQQAPTAPTALTAADVQAAVTAERERVSGIRALGRKHAMTDDFIDGLVAADTSLDAARAQILDKLAAGSESEPIGHSRAVVTADARDKWVEGATNWLLVKAGVSGLVETAARARGETLRIDPGEFRGMRNVDLAREALVNGGHACDMRAPEAIVRAAMTAQGAITQSTGDFPILFENAIHRTLQASYATTPDTWSRICHVGTVTDFRDHNRYLRGNFGALDSLNENGEFKNKPISDLTREKIRAGTKGNIISLSRQAIVNDDMEVFSGLAVDLGRAAKHTIEIDFYALLASNPVMSDTVAFFHASHSNLNATGTAPSVEAFDAIRVAMAKQMNIAGNEYLDIRPAIGLFPINIGGTARVINDAQYDPDTVNKLQRPNKVRGLLRDIVDTPRLGSPLDYYFFADPAVAPAFEVAFLNGVTEPFIDSEEGWRVDGVEWKVRHDYGIAALNWRSAYKQTGA